MLADEILTPRLKLRLFSFTDVPAVWKYLQEPAMGRFLEGELAPPTKEITQSIIARHTLVDRNERDVWAITLDDVAVGAVSINYHKGHRIAEIGYSVKKPLWGKGYAAEAVQAVVDAAFANCKDLQRIQANIHPQNEGSIHVARKVGMTHEATLRAYSYVDGEVCDEVIYTILRDEHSG